MKREEVILNACTKEDLHRRIGKLAAAYTPEWHFSSDNPDVGSTLALLYADQLADNIRRFNRLPEKYHTEFVNLMGLSLQPAYPASGVVVAGISRGTIPGTMIYKGTRLLADGYDEAAVSFETVEDIYLTNARLTDMLCVSGTQGKIIPLLGGPKSAQLVPVPQEFPPSEKAQEETSETENSFRLFDFSEQGIEKNALLLYHSTVLNTREDTVLMLYMTAEDGASLAEEFSDALRWRWSYYDGSGLKPFDEVSVQDGMLRLCRSTPSQEVQVDATAYHMLCLEALETVEQAIWLREVRIASRVEAKRPEVLLHEDEELAPEDCMPFGDTVSVFDEFYIGDDKIFSQKDARITLSFTLSSREKVVALSTRQVEEELKVIKRKPRIAKIETEETSPQRISMEYYNGIGWRKLSCSNDWAGIFDGTHSGTQRISFLCPEDWRGVSVGGYSGRMIRVRVTQADNCYLIPCRHTMPILSDVTLSYEYAGQWKLPQRLCTVCGTQTEDQTNSLLTKKPITAFRPLPYPPAALYLGFDRPLEKGPISLFFDVMEDVRFRTEPVCYEYATRTGFKPLKVVDGTRSFSGDGAVHFLPPSDFVPMEVEGVRRWWIRIVASQSGVTGYHPAVSAVMLNAIRIRNQKTLEQQSFFITAAQPDMVFPLGVEDILFADVFVNEFGEHSRHAMEDLLEQRPKDVKVQYDVHGEITSFFVRWTEVDSFDASKPDDRHYRIDRMNGTLIFGDGVHVRIPHGRSETAFTVRCVSCSGARGNLPAGTVNRFQGNILYVESVTNPVETYAGSDMETPENARRRGADLLSNRGRLISQADFTRAVFAFSDSVKKVKCLAGHTIDGYEDPSLVTIAVMTDDYDTGAYSFNNLREPLLRHLLNSCDATVTPECLVLSEPVYVEISVSVWATVNVGAQVFDIQNMILERIRAYLDPLGQNGAGGWDIGVLPTENQLRMLLNSLHFEGSIRHMIVTAKYGDRDNVHESTLDRLPHNPFVICAGGKHQIHVEYQ